MIIEINPEYPQPHKIDQVVDSLRNGGVIAYPTDTTYGCLLYTSPSPRD